MAFTYFFRDRETLELIAQLILPRLRGRKYINIWDAGCADGSEAYSLAIILRENMSDFGFRNVRIYATDIDESGKFSETVSKGIYHVNAVKRIGKELLRKYFIPVNRDSFQVREDIRKRVEFRKHNLLSYEPVRLGFCLVLCKNVLLHFKHEERVNVIRMFHRALSDPGFFVTEQTQKLPEEVKGLFKPITKKGQLFQKIPCDINKEFSIR